MDIPIFPLNTVLFPGGRLSLRIFEQRYLDMTKACIRDDSVFGVCHILDGKEVGDPAVPASLGCIARIVEWDVPAPGLFSLVTRGEDIFSIIEHRTEPGGLIRAEVEFQPEPEFVDVPENYSSLPRTLAEIIEQVGADNFLKPFKLEDAAWVGYRYADLLPLSGEQKLQLLAERDPLKILRTIEQVVREMDKH